MSPGAPPAPWLVCLLSLLIVSQSGCGHFITLKGEVKRLDSDVYLGGVIPAAAGDGTTIVAVYRQPALATPEFVEVARLGAADTAFGFSLPPAPDYGLVALWDRNGNGAYDEGEAWWNRSSIVFGAAHRAPPLTVAWSTEAMPEPLRRALHAARKQGLAAAQAVDQRVPVALGQLADWDAPRFSRAAGSQGLWEPATSLNRYGVGIWFLEPYDPQRIPVLLVHGIGGTAGDWRDFAPKLDRSRFQVWLFAYPSGLRLAESADILERGVARLHERYGFARLDIVAHSMGGLAARRYLLDAAGRGQADWVRHFVTLSTPWAGHEAAALGVDYAPATVPAWIDLQTDSEFTRALRAQPLPPGIIHSLGFTFDGRNLPVLPPSNDGTVSLASELAEPIQAQAAGIRGFDLPHAGTLHSKEAAEWVNGVLGE